MPDPGPGRPTPARPVLVAGEQWVGIDVGGRRKGFHVASIDGDRQVTLARAPTAEACRPLLRGASVVAIDSPRRWAEAGESSRADEREFAGAGVCGIRFTPSEAVARAHPGTYYEWIECGLELWHLIDAEDVEAIECFPTASWTAWIGPRRGTRAAWTRGGLARFGDAGFAGLDAARNQDFRDAFAAALTARQHRLSGAEMRVFGDLVVPPHGWPTAVPRNTHPPSE